MAKSNGPVASAVILPNTLSRSPSPPRKRRASSSHPPVSPSKRTRLSEPGPSDTATVAHKSLELPGNARQSSNPENGKTARSRPSVLEERKRGRRLFGGLLSTLSQTTSSGSQKRRQEIERSQAEKLKTRKIDEEAARRDTLDTLSARRRQAQVKFDELSMRLRHRNELAMATFLKTETEPRLYYKPWDHLPSQAAVIKSQMTATKIVIDREVDEWQQRHQEHTTEQEHDEMANRSQNSGDNRERETKGEQPQANLSEASHPSHTLYSSVSNPMSDDTANPTYPLGGNMERDNKVNKGDDSMKAETHDEHNGEVVLEAEEDTVIY